VRPHPSVIVLYHLLEHLLHGRHTRREQAHPAKGDCRARRGQLVELFDIAVQKAFTTAPEFRQPAVHHNSAIPVAAVEFIVYAE
jgi:hypothetical protein